MRKLLEHVWKTKIATVVNNNAIREFGQNRNWNQNPLFRGVQGFFVKRDQLFLLSVMRDSVN